VAIALAATWNPDAAKADGDVIGEEARKRGKDIMLGPGVHIMRTPLNGRSFEYLGEDPYLASRLAVSYIRAVQSHGVASCVKHFAASSAARTTTCSTRF
jgi:beta-glucosidase